jgi:signal transduction histidine kinase
MAFPNVFSLPRPLIGAVYLAGYVALDWVSFIHPFASFGITPWNPFTGLSFVLVLLFGQRFIPLLFVAPVLADFAVRRFPFPWPVELATALVIGAGYSAALIYLLRPQTRFNPALPSMRDLLRLLLCAGVSATFVACGYVGVLLGAGFLQRADFFAATLRLWVGDMIGVAVVTPLALILFARGRLLPASKETAAQILAIVAALALVFVFAEKHHFQLFYVLFLPIVWMAVRTGLEGVTVGILLTQIGLIVGVQSLPAEEFDVTAFQALMLVLTLTGLIAGMVVTEHRRVQFQVRLHQDSLARLARLGSMGELAAAVAHEINQPLTAAGTYARLVVDTLREGTPDDRTAIETADKAAMQVERAAAVVRRLRALIRLDQSGRAPVSMSHIVNETLALCQPDLDRHNIRTRVIIDPDVPSVMVDVLQVEQVLLNLMRNAIDAMQASGPGGLITIEVSRSADAGAVEVRVRDTGPGFPAEVVSEQFLPLSSTKDEGLGIGLSLSRSIVESHGGTLTLGGNAQGAVVTFTLPADSHG